MGVLRMSQVAQGRKKRCARHLSTAGFGADHAVADVVPEYFGVTHDRQSALAANA